MVLKQEENVRMILGVKIKHILGYLEEPRVKALKMCLKQKTYVLKDELGNVRGMLASLRARRRF